MKDWAPIVVIYWYHVFKWFADMMTWSNWNIFRVTGPLCWEFTVPVNSPHKGQWREALVFSLIYAWINDWVNNREDGDLRRHLGHYDVIVMDYSVEEVTDMRTIVSIVSRTTCPILDDLSRLRYNGFVLYMETGYYLHQWWPSLLTHICFVPPRPMYLMFWYGLSTVIWFQRRITNSVQRPSGNSQKLL